MHCNAKTMIKIAAALGAFLAATYVAVPEARALVSASAPVLLALICPITMIAMMFMMKAPAGERRETACSKPQPGADQDAGVRPSA